MLTGNAMPNFLFIINPASGSNNSDWVSILETHFKDKQVNTTLFTLSKNCTPAEIKEMITKTKPDKVIAVGGDGTVKLVATALLHGDIPMGIFPAGSANGMAREFNIPADPVKALDIIEHGKMNKIHLVKVNDEVCIHLSDIGFNAFLIKKFEEENTRGMWGYFKAAIKVLWRHSRMKVHIKCDDGYINRSAAMVVIANGSRYGNGVVINPSGTLTDQLFEVVIIRQISFYEIFKMRFFSNHLNPKKTEVVQTSHLRLTSKRNLHFQVDGEYLGRTKVLTAEIIPDAINVVVP